LINITYTAIFSSQNRCFTINSFCSHIIKSVTVYLCWGSRMWRH